MIGYQSISENGIRWRENQGGLFPIAPTALLNDIKIDNVKSLLKRTKQTFIRWESEFDKSVQTSWWYVVNDTNCEIENLSSKTRSKVRKGAKEYDAIIVDSSFVANYCYSIYVSAYERYTTHEEMFLESDFKKAVKSLPKETEFWVLLSKSGKSPVAFSENYIGNGVCSYVTTWYEPDSLKKYSSYFLIQAMTKHYLDRDDISYVSNGTKSISHDTNAHELLERRFNFRKAYACLHVVYTPWLGAAVACAYPFRKMISKVSLSPFKKASILLKQEEIRRSCTRVAG